MLTGQNDIGDYRVVRQLEAGPLGSVVLAEHRLLKRLYVLKVFAQANAQQLERFEKTLSSLAQLKHPYLQPIHSAQVVANRLCLVSDWADGEWGTLGQLLQSRGGAISEEETHQILRPMAAALDYLHSQQPPQLHGSLRPDVIWLQTATTGGASLQVRVADFGWSQIVGQLDGLVAGQESLAAHFAFNQALMQGFAFLAPEQKKGGQATAASDVYAFGVLAYLMLMGEFPEGIFDLPSQRLGPAPRQWDRVVTECLRSDPRKRPNSLVRLLDECSQVPAFEMAPKTEALNLQMPLSSAVKPFVVEKVVSSYTAPKDATERPHEPLRCPMAPIPAGKYWRGSDIGQRDEGPRHQVHLGSFWIDVHPVTNEQYMRFLEGVGSEKDSQHNDLIRLRESRLKRAAGKLTIEPGYAQHPVVGVTWYGAAAYAEWVGKRLPTEAEWEIAALGGVADATYPTGAVIDKAQANFFSSDTTAVMSFPPNQYGLFDMAGNVYEWCHDWYGYNYYDCSAQEPDQPSGPHQGIYRVLRGGCWRSVKEDLRCAHRHRNNPGTVNSTYGFRCASSQQVVR